MILCSASRGLTVPRRCWGAFRQPAVEGPSSMHGINNHAEVTEDVMAAFRKELGR